MGAQPSSRAAHRIVLSAARIASFVAGGQVPPGKELFALAAAVVEAAHQHDAEALKVGLHSSAALLDGLPGDKTWEACRSQLSTTMQFAWLLSTNSRA